MVDLGNICQDCGTRWTETYMQVGESVTYKIVDDVNDCEECDGEAAEYTEPSEE
jgi:hypothetical protein